MTPTDTLTPEDAARLRAVEADVLYGVLVLDWLRRKGGTRATDELRRVVSSLEPSEFDGGLGAAWCAVRHLHAAGEPITHERVLDVAGAWWDRGALTRTLRTVEDHGLPLGWNAREAARRLLEYREARRRYDEARSEAASAVEAMRNALRGVTGIAA